MYNLFRYVIRNGAFILFVMCEFAAIYLVVQYNQKQKKIFLYSSEQIAAGIYDQYDQLLQYFDLTTLSDSLAWENARLRARLYDLEMGMKAGAGRMRSEDTSAMYSLVPVKVISNGVAGRNNIMMLSAGRKKGMEEGIGLIGPAGPVGIVTAVTSDYARAISILHSQSSISARLKGTNYFGSLTWESTNPQLMKLNAVPKHAVVSIGNTVETSGYSLIFPEGIEIGTIKSYRLPPGSNFYDIEVLLSYDMSNLTYVYAIRNMKTDQLDSLQFDPYDQ